MTAQALLDKLNNVLRVDTEWAPRGPPANEDQPIVIHGNHGRKLRAADTATLNKIKEQFPCEYRRGGENPVFPDNPNFLARKFPIQYIPENTVHVKTVEATVTSRIIRITEKAKGSNQLSVSDVVLQIEFDNSMSVFFSLYTITSNRDPDKDFNAKLRTFNYFLFRDFERFDSGVLQQSGDVTIVYYSEPIYYHLRFQPIHECISFEEPETPTQPPS
jgi:hypothetical protein